MSNDNLIIGDLIGRGSYADVHLGTYCGSQVAIKKCRLPLSNEYSKHRDKCIKEASLLKTLHHENILHYIEIFEDTTAKTMCFLLEYIDGGTMERFCQQNSVTLSDICKYQIAYFCWNGLTYLHQKNIVHKDIKPTNILISQDLKTVKIADFGFAELKPTCMYSIYSTCTWQGTDMYAPPELLARGKRKKFSRHVQKSDVYSMGATLCEFFSRLPFWSNGNQPKNSSAVLSIMYDQWAAVQNETKPLEPSCWKGINIHIQKILISAINADYTKRKTAKEMLELFQNLSYNKTTINALLVGRSGSGKTAIIETLINENAFVKCTTGYSITKVPSCHTFVLKQATNDALYKLNILDTPGLQECNKDPSQNRTDDTLLNLTKQYIKEHVTFLNVVCFVTMAGKTLEQDVEIFKALKEFLGPNYSSNAMIILTHCEQIPDKTFEQYKTNLREHPYTKDVYEYCQLGVFSYGAVNKDHLVDLEEKVQGKVIEVQRRRTAGMRIKLTEAFIGCADKPVPVFELSVNNIGTSTTDLLVTSKNCCNDGATFPVLTLANEPSVHKLQPVYVKEKSPSTNGDTNNILASTSRVPTCCADLMKSIMRKDKKLAPFDLIDSDGQNGGNLDDIDIYGHVKNGRTTEVNGDAFEPTSLESRGSEDSWEAIDENDSRVSFWVPAHSVSRCMNCGEEFWNVKRNHCSNCGKIFCNSCSNYECPVPEEQFFDPVRVCYKCYGSLCTTNGVVSPS